MGKASKWLRNLLTGKREDTEKKKDTSFFTENLVISTEILLESPNHKQRWSFGRSSASKDKTNHKSSKSWDEIATTRLVSRDLLDYRSEQNRGTDNLVALVAAAKYENAQKLTKTIPVPYNEGAAQTVVAAPYSLATEFGDAAMKIQATYLLAREFGVTGDAAATKIQAFFRSHLARKALKALRGLVKIQALVRGHLVRKQTNEILRCMNSLMSIQVRARVQRIQMTEEPPLIVKRQLTDSEPAYDKLRRGNAENMDLVDTRGSFRRNKDYTKHQQMESMEHEFSTNYSGKISISKQKHQFLVQPNPSPVTDTSSSQYDEFSYKTPNRMPEQIYSVSNFNHIRVPQSPSLDYSDTSHNSQFGPNYLTNTESSRAKARSHSEPKQRPFKQKTRRSPSFGGMNTTPDNWNQNQSSNRKKSQQPWLIKIYRAAKSSKYIECDSTPIGTSSSTYYRTLTAYEVGNNY